MRQGCVAWSSVCARPSPHLQPGSLARHLWTLSWSGIYRSSGGRQGSPSEALSLDEVSQDPASKPMPTASPEGSMRPRCTSDGLIAQQLRLSGWGIGMTSTSLRAVQGSSQSPRPLPVAPASLSAPEGKGLGFQQGVYARHQGNAEGLAEDAVGQTHSIRPGQSCTCPKGLGQTMKRPYSDIATCEGRVGCQTRNATEGGNQILPVYRIPR